MCLCMKHCHKKKKYTPVPNVLLESDRHQIAHQLLREQLFIFCVFKAKVILVILQFGLMPGDVVGLDKLPQWLRGAPLHRLISSSVSFSFTLPPLPKPTQRSAELRQQLQSDANAHPLSAAYKCLLTQASVCL